MTAMRVAQSDQAPMSESERDRRLRFTKRQRLRRPADFRRVYEAKNKAGDSHVLVFAAANELAETRLGLSVSKKHGSAVKRNRIKRLLREAFRLSQHELPGGLDLIVIPRPESGATLADYRRSLVGCVRRIRKRMPDASTQPDRDTSASETSATAAPPSGTGAKAEVDGGEDRR